MDPYFNTLNLSQTTSDEPYYDHNNNDDLVITNDGNMNIFPDCNYQNPISNSAYATSNNIGVAIPHHNYQKSISNDAPYDNVTSSNYQSNDNDNTIFPHNDIPNVNVAISPSYYDYQKTISNGNSGNSSDHNNYEAYPRYADQNQSQSNIFPSPNSINITINSPQTNISEIFKFGLKIIIMPLTNEKY
ncbi:hypothetical protein RclHR1_00110015 [Rhizophagus clarus]|uniref:Uncharacterized protein n=1 Tax=Rhizophagus clarus TaxID=94130 RepID=A0A2Z6Q7N9_9GLOM|nr:hypothetical protein RclHR1_00110015 [Rhizophagus clarus]GES98007.1 hypothetical protein GLOIN_2v1765032 [Rhizophagus clarus]